METKSVHYFCFVKGTFLEFAAVSALLHRSYFLHDQLMYYLVWAIDDCLLCVESLQFHPELVLNF